MGVAEKDLQERSEAGTETVNPYLAVFVAWLVPGAGHFLLGRRSRALIFAVLAAISLAIGVYLEGDIHRDVPAQPFMSLLWNIGAWGLGVAYVVLRHLVGYSGTITAASYEYGSAFVLTAGLMNLLLMLDAWDIARGRKP